MFSHSRMSAGREFQVEQQQKKSEKIRKLHRFNNNIQVVIVLPVQENFFKKFEKLLIFKKMLDLKENQEKSYENLKNISQTAKGCRKKNYKNENLAYH